MKELFIIALLALTILVNGCVEEQTFEGCTEEAKVCPDGSIVVRVPPTCEFTPCPEIPEEKECNQDSDCVKGGCSGTLCQSKKEEPVFTTCEYLPEYACYKQIKCKCVDNKCQWDKTEKFEECISKARETLNK